MASYPALRTPLGASLFACWFLVGCGEAFVVSDDGSASSTTSGEATGVSTSSAGGGGSTGTTTGSGTGGAPATTATTSGTGGNLPGVEQCTNGLDDDGDDHVDCADSDCDAFSCVEETPAGWEGPITLYRGDVANPVPSCGAAWPQPLQVSTDISAPDGGCTCACGAATGSDCLMPSLALYSANGACGNNPAATLSLQDGQCVAVGGAALLVASAKAELPLATGGACTPSVDGFPPDYGWKTTGLLCSGADVGEGCSPGGVCVPKPDGEFQGGVCIAADGDVACPVGAFQSRHVFYTGADDSRDCGACFCGAPFGQTCSGSTTVYSDGGCQASVGTVANNGQCQGLNSLTASSAKYQEDANQPAGGSCAPAGGGPLGTVTPTGALTVCCSG